MNRIHWQYLIVCAIACFLTNMVVAIFFVALIRGATGLAFVSACITNLTVASFVALLAGRKSATAFKMIDARLGAVSGLWMGIWVGIGAIFGMASTGAMLGWLFGAMGYPTEIRSGLVMTFGILSALICIFAARIAGREAAHPPEEEET